MSDEGNEHFLRRVDFMHLPIGVYVLADDGGFLAANEGARRILGLPETGPIEVHITDLHAEPDDHLRRLAAAREAEARGERFEKSIAHFRVHGRDVFAEDFLSPLRDEAHGEIQGYVGCMADITEEHTSALHADALRAKVEELTLDIGRILHANTSTLLMVNQTLTAAARALDPGIGPEPTHPVEPESIEPYKEHATVVRGQLASALERLIESGDPERRERALSDESWSTLAAQVPLLRDVEQIVEVPEVRNPLLRTSAAAIAGLLREIPRGLLPREPLRDALRLALDLQRVLVFLDVLATRTTVIQMDYSLRALRDFITAEVRAHERPRRLQVNHLVQEAIAQLAEFARASNVDIEWRQKAPDVEVIGEERDLVRAVSNLLHNAIKYSWQRDRANSPWVAIRAHVEEDEERICIEFETWGVPITHEEIDRGLVFQMGYRGKWSTDRGRLGTGIGLTDALRVAQTHGGELRIDSKPAQSTALAHEDEEYYRHPFLTRVSLHLPLAGS